MLENKKKISRQWIVIAVIFAVCIVINAVSWLSVDFSDWYRDNLFLTFQPIWSRISGAFPFSVGEIMLCIAVFGGIGAIISYIILMIKCKGKRKRISAVYGKILGWILAFVFTALSFNFFPLYHCSGFARVHGISENKYTAQQLYDLTMQMIDKCNESVKSTKRADGRFVLTADIKTETAEAMRNISGEYKSLGGYYPKPKAIDFAKLMTQFNLLGIYFPYSMEANYNPWMYEAEQPSTICHEFAHLKGWIYEDDANFIAFLACINSENPAFVYSGYLLAVDYMYSKVYNDPSITDEQITQMIARMSDELRFDLNEQHDIFREMKKSKIGKTAAKVSNTVIDASLKFNGVEDGEKSYGRFVDLLLNYYLGSEQ